MQQAMTREGILRLENRTVLVLGPKGQIEEISALSARRATCPVQINQDGSFSIRPEKAKLGWVFYRKACEKEGAGWKADKLISYCAHYRKFPNAPRVAFPENDLAMEVLERRKNNGMIAAWDPNSSAQPTSEKITEQAELETYSGDETPDTSGVSSGTKRSKTRA